ncbi:Bhp1, hydrophobin class I [Sclerotinia borealis F-4128]|uniref:Hydrophobin n=1 Tax=Sclerotinia borealis (strain F-4128) TaxID=1432307 RepID=W9CLR4_SCLBF|nr:Bhp1, hydrophobin class I [Sclerotinia borealis F-4128]
MRFTLATAVLSLAAMVIASPMENGLWARDNGAQCAQGSTIQCCQSVTSAGDGGLLSNLLGLNCAEIPIPILNIINTTPKCNGQLACCSANTGTAPPDCDDDSNSGGSQGINILSNLAICPNIIL